MKVTTYICVRITQTTQQLHELWRVRQQERSHHEHPKCRFSSYLPSAVHPKYTLLICCHRLEGADIEVEHGFAILGRPWAR